MATGPIVLILGSSPAAPKAAMWPKTSDLRIVAINNAWRVRPDWDVLIHPEDFPVERRPTGVSPPQRLCTHTDYVPAQNRLGGFVFAGGTMAFTAGYWALDALRPSTLAYYGCDMIYDGPVSHFYGQGTADPLRDDITLRSLEAKSGRLLAIAARQGCSCVNLSDAPTSRLLFPRADTTALTNPSPVLPLDIGGIDAILDAESRLGYMVESGRYWTEAERFDADALARIDTMWLQLLCWTPVAAQPATVPALPGDEGRLGF
ncbi:hypothetical protein [Hoeflea marina]|nr:hypothetical protein [Hoeflea marina]